MKKWTLVLLVLLFSGVLKAASVEVSPSFFGLTLPPNTSKEYTIYVVDTSGECPEGADCIWQARSEVPWIDISTITGTIPDRITFTVDTSDLGEGEELRGYIVLTLGQREETIPVYLRVKSTPPAELPDGMTPVQGPFKYVEISDSETLNLALLYDSYVPDNVFVLVSSDDLFPGITLSYQGGHKFCLADEGCSMGEGPFSYIPFGPFPLRGINGEIEVSVRVGKSLLSAKEAQRVLIKVNTLDGVWRVVDVFKGSYYIYPDSMMLVINRSGVSYSGSWGPTPVAVSYCTGDCLYLIEFDEGGLHYIYKVEKLTTHTIEGEWSWGHDPGNMQGWEPFFGYRVK